MTDLILPAAQFIAGLSAEAYWRLLFTAVCVALWITVLRGRLANEREQTDCRTELASTRSHLFKLSNLLVRALTSFRQHVERGPRAAPANLAELETDAEQVLSAIRRDIREHAPKAREDVESA